MNSRLLFKLIAIQFKALFLGRQKKIKKSTIVLLVIGVLYLLLVLFALFGSLFLLLNKALVPAGLRWLYYAFIALIATSFGIIGMVYAAYTQLFLAKDNSILMPLPISRWMILTSRLTSSYLTLLGIEGFFVILGMGIDFYNFGFDFYNLILVLLALLFLPMIALALASLLALIFSIVMRFAGRFQKILAIALYLGGFLLYFWGVNQLNSDLFISMSNSAASLQAVFEGPFMPLMWFGQWVDGQWLSALLFILTSLVIMGILVSLLSTQLGKNNTDNKRVSGPRGVRLSQKSTLTWLIKKEWALLTSQALLLINACSPTFMSILMIFICETQLSSKLEVISFVLPVLLFVPVTMSVYTAGSVSLERNCLWIIKSLPIETKTLFIAKLITGTMITGSGWLLILIYILIKGVAINQAFIMCALISLLLTLLEQLTGLLANVWKPRFDFMNYTAAVKQGTSVLVQLFGSMGFAAIFATLLILEMVTLEQMLYIALGVVLILLVLTWKVLMTWGVKRYERITC